MFLSADKEKRCIEKFSVNDCIFTCYGNGFAGQTAADQRKLSDMAAGQKFDGISGHSGAACLGKREFSFADFKDFRLTDQGKSFESSFGCTALFSSAAVDELSDILIFAGFFQTGNADHMTAALIG